MLSKSQTFFASPELIRTPATLREVLGARRKQANTIGFVPTMGALHEGHKSLVRASRDECDVTVVSIFVNPTQFGPGEDFAAYPRTLQQDLELLKAAGAQFVFAPAKEDIYRRDHSTFIDVGPVAEPLEGRFRPTHFRGVATVVLKLLNLVSPDVAYFGQKDYQQTLVVRRMCEELDVPVQLRVCPIIREPNGLALSSRNAYLSAMDRERATAISRALSVARQLVRGDVRDAQVIESRMREVLTSAGITDIDYAVVAHPETLAPLDAIGGPAVALIAAKVGTTRLIDNEILTSPDP